MATGTFAHNPFRTAILIRVGTFPNYLNGYVPPNRVERFRLLRNSVCRAAFQPVFYCETSGQNLKISGLRSDFMRGWGQKCAKICFFVDTSCRLLLLKKSNRKGGAWAPRAALWLHLCKLSICSIVYSTKLIFLLKVALSYPNNKGILWNIFHS